MKNEKLTVKELIKILEDCDLEKTVRVSVIYDDVEHIQKLKGVCDFEGIPWITLRGG